MATVKPIEVGTPIETPEGVSTITPTNANQAAAISSVLGTINMATATADTAAPPLAKGLQGLKLFKDADGNTFAVANAKSMLEAAGAKPGKILALKLKDMPEGTPIILEGSGIGKVKGGNADEKIISSSNDEMAFKTGGGNDTIVSTGFSNGSFKTGTGDDYAVGGRGDDILNGGSGADTLKGSDGSDEIQGGSENDVIDGGAGNNDLSGGSDSDTFIFGADADGINTVNDFKQEDILKIADRNGDGEVTEGDTGDFTKETIGKDIVIHLQDADGNEDARVVLKGAGKSLLKESADDDGTFTLS